jgi:hypothetical protein
MHGTGRASLPIVDGGTDAAQGIVSTNLEPSYGVMEAVAQGALAHVVCEREPAGARSAPCSDDPSSFCFTVLATLSQKKHYRYNPTSVSAEDAEKYCKALTDGGTSSLVVFGSRAEREQVIYELSQLNLLPGGGVEGVPSFFWIGLRLVVPDGGVHDGGASVEAGAYVWDDGVRAGTLSTDSRPSVWGIEEPKTKGAMSARAYVQMHNDYDNGLAHARSSDGGAPYYPFVCQD